METKALEDIGLTKAEIKTYLALLELGSSKAGPIIEKSELQSSVVHNALHSLTEKGLISYIKKRKIKHYQATAPKRILDFIEEKKANIKKILPAIISKQKALKEKNEAEVYEGSKGIMNLLLELISKTKPGDEYSFFSADIEPMNKEIQDFFEKFGPKRRAKKLLTKGIAHPNLKPFLEEKVKRGGLEIKYTKKPIPQSIGICNDKIAIFTWGEKPIGYLIHSKQLADKYKEYFDAMWNSIR